MNFTVYIRRAIKSIVYISALFFVILGTLYIFSDKEPGANFFDFIVPKHNRLPMLGFIIVFSLIYPFISYIKKTIYLNKSFEDERENIMRIFDTTGYEIVSEHDKKINFRLTNKFARVTRMMEDTIELDYSDNPIVLSGIRKDAYRIGKHIEYLTTKADIEE